MFLSVSSSVAGPSVFLWSVHAPFSLFLCWLPGDPLEQLVRHFLIETGPRGVKIKGCQNESYFGQFIQEMQPKLNHIFWISSNTLRDPICAAFTSAFLPFLGSLSALVYQHSITPISLPCALRIPEKGWVFVLSVDCCCLHSSKWTFVFLMMDDCCFRPGWGTPGDKEYNQHQHSGWPPQTRSRLELDVLRLWYANAAVLQLKFTLIDVFPAQQACNVLYLNSVETECLTGPEAVSKATKCTLALNPRPAATVVHFKVSAQGITLTDNKRRYSRTVVP